jgi:hypothetical protein
LETPDGDILDPSNAATVGATFGVGNRMSYFRFTLPLPLAGKPAQDGTWYVLLDLEDLKGAIGNRLEGTQTSLGRLGRGIRYNVSVQSFSNLRMTAGVTQDSLEPGANLRIRAGLTEYGVPVDHRAIVRAAIERPDATLTTVQLAEIDAGVFEAIAPSALPGVYRIQVLAQGVTMRGLPFTRDQSLTAATVPGGNVPFATTDPSQGRDAKLLCELINCLLEPGALGRLLEEHHVDSKLIWACLEHWCRQVQGGLSDEEAREREGTTAAPAPAVTEGAAAMAQLMPLLEAALRRAQATQVTAVDLGKPAPRPSRRKES